MTLVNLLTFCTGVYSLNYQSLQLWGEIPWELAVQISESPYAEMTLEIERERDRNKEGERDGRKERLRK